MRLNGNSPATKVKVFFCALAVAAAAIAPGTAVARGPKPGRGWDRGGGHVRQLPRGHRQTVVRGNRYYYNHGRFYRPGPRGYRRVRPPFGAIVNGLPIGFSIMVAAGLTYYSYLGVYYRRAPAGYVVVSAPPVVVSAPPRGGGPFPRHGSARHPVFGERAGDRRELERAPGAGL